jgi:hypothetical protein
MPWEIDYVLLSFSQLKKSKYYLSNDVNVAIYSVLNLSSYLINWEESKLPKEYFIDKYNQLSVLLSDYNHNKKIYEGNKLYGHLNLQKECIQKETDYYIHICPDIYFSEYLLAYLIESTKQIKNKYFVITPQISKVGDAAWDEITDPKYVNIPYNEYLNVDTFDVIHNNVNSDQEKSLSPTQQSKWAGWFDLYNKKFYEELCPVQEDWKGYGPWDWYSLMITDYVKQQGVDFQQYLLKGETIWMYSSGPLVGENINGFSKYYKDMIKINNIPNQRQSFESKMNEYVNKTLTNLKDKNILK